LDLRFDESPLEFCLGDKSGALGAEELRRLEGIYFVVDVWKRHADLFAVVVCDDGIGGVWIVDHKFFGISEQEMLEAVLQSGGSLDRSGSYRISRTIEEKLSANREAFLGIEACAKRGETERPGMKFLRTKLFILPGKR
jgi:hypothetical protein